MNDYKDFLPFLKRELEQLESKKLNLSVESILDVLSKRGSDSADNAVQEYGSSLMWPEISDPVRFEICLRMRVAIWWIESLHEDTSNDGEPLQVFLTDVLINYWRDVGRTDWISNHLVNQDVVI